MQKFNGKEYKLGLLDTCIISEILENPNDEMKGFFNRFINSTPIIIPCVTFWSVLELRQIPKYYNKFIEFFTAIPFCMLKLPDQLLEYEYEYYPYFNKIDPVLFTFSSVRPKTESLTVFLKNIFSRREVKNAEKNWKHKWKQERLNDILYLKKNFVSKNKHLNSNDAAKFINEALPQYVTFQKPDWVNEKIIKNEDIIFDAFPSAKTALYTVFYRFYVSNREPEVQDIFDIFINTVVPYVDVVVTENFQSDILNKIKKADKQFAHLEIETIKSFR